jgi:hypothetical protein
MSAACNGARFEYGLIWRDFGAHKAKNRRRPGAPAGRDTSLDVNNWMMYLANRSELLVQSMLDKDIRVQQILTDLGMDDARDGFSDGAQYMKIQGILTEEPFDIPTTQLRSRDPSSIGLDCTEHRVRNPCKTLRRV